MADLNFPQAKSKKLLFEIEFERRSSMFLDTYDELINQGFDLVIFNLPFFYRKNKPGNDLDILVRNDQWEAINQFLIINKRYSYVNSYIDSTQVILRRFDDKSGEFIMLHLHNGICYFGLSALNFEDIKNESICIDGSLFVPCAKTEICLLALQYFFRRKFIYLDRIDEVVKTAFGGVDNDLHHLLCTINMSSRFTGILVNMIENSTAVTNARIFSILLLCFPHKAQIYLVLWRKVWRRLKPFVSFRRNGQLIFYMGVDGSGKSTLVTETSKKLSLGGYNTKISYWGIRILSLQKLKLYFLGKGEHTDAVHSPSNYVSRLSGASKYLSLALHACISVYYIIEYNVRIFHAVVFVRRSNTILLVDRSYYDNISGKGKFGDTILFSMLPKPDLVIHCRGDLRAIMDRKPELSFGDLKSSSKNIEFLIDYISREGIMVSKVNTVTLDVDESTSQALTSIVSHRKS